MTAELAPTLDGLRAASGELDMLRTAATGFEKHRMSPNTARAYYGDWTAFERWCNRHGLPSLPADPETVRLYLTDLSIQATPDGQHRLKASTIERSLAAIAAIHKAGGHGRGIAHHEDVAGVMAGIRRVRAEPRNPRQPLLLDDLTAIVNDLDHRWPSAVSATRDHFLLMFGFASAMRRSEVAALTAGDVTRSSADGLHIRLGVTKTDQEGLGTTLAIPYGSNPATCVPCAWVRWTSMLAAANEGRTDLMKLAMFDRSKHACRSRLPHLNPDQTLAVAVNKSGAIFTDRPLSGSALNEVVKRRMAAAGYDCTSFGFHSLRAGFVTQARRNGADTRSVRKQTRHGSDHMVDVYDRDHTPLRDNAVNVLGL